MFGLEGDPCLLRLREGTTKFPQQHTNHRVCSYLDLDFARINKHHFLREQLGLSHNLGRFLIALGNELAVELSVEYGFLVPRESLRNLANQIVHHLSSQVPKPPKGVRIS